MQSIVSRRKILIASLGAAAVGLTRTAQAAPANVPSIWDGKKMYDSFLKDGTGFSFPHKPNAPVAVVAFDRSEEHTSELQSLAYRVCRLLLEKK